MERIFVDTSAWIALANTADPDHEAVSESLSGWDGRMVTTSAVVGETVTVALYRFGHEAATSLGERLWRGDIADVVRPDAQDEREAWSLFVNRSDKTYSFVDCVSFTVMRRLKLVKAVAIDDDFDQEGFDVVPRRNRGRR